MEDKIKQAAKDYAESVCTNPDYPSISKECCEIDYAAGVNKCVGWVLKFIESERGGLGISDKKTLDRFEWYFKTYLFDK